MRVSMLVVSTRTPAPAFSASPMESLADESHRIRTICRRVAPELPSRLR